MDPRSFFVEQSPSRTAGLMERFLHSQACNHDWKGNRSSASGRGNSMQRYFGEDLLGGEQVGRQVGRTIYTAVDGSTAPFDISHMSEAEEGRLLEGENLAAWRQEQRVRRQEVRSAYRNGKGFAWLGNGQQVDDPLSPNSEEAISLVEGPNAYDPTRTDEFDPTLYQKLLEIEALQETSAAKAEDLMANEFFGAFIDGEACGAF